MKKFIIAAVLLSLFIVFLSFFFQLSQVIGRDMEPTLKNRQMILFRKLLFLPIGPNRGDTVLYKPKNSNNDFVGRVIALPSESIRFENGNFYLDDNIGQYRVEEEYLPSTKTRTNDDGRWIKLDRHEYFIVGDRRSGIINIKDHTIHKNNIKGVLFLKF